MAQITSERIATIAEWWDAIHPYAVKLEKNITTAPQELSQQDIDVVIRTLPEILRHIQHQPHPGCAAIMREYLLRATTYLLHAYQELANNNTDEVDFYYSTALTNVARLHHQLVEHGFAN